jgi:hypothetical protein
MIGPDFLARLETSILRDVIFIFFVLDLIPLLHRRFQAIARLFRRRPISSPVERVRDLTAKERLSEDRQYKRRDGRLDHVEPHPSKLSNPDPTTMPFSR